MKPIASKFSYGVAILLVAGYAVYILQGPNGVSALNNKRQRIDELEKANLRRVKDNEQLKDRIRRLQESQQEQDLILHQKLKVVGPNDNKVYILPESETTVQSPKK